MILYSDARSTNCIKVLAVARQVGAMLNVRPIDIGAGAQRSADFLAINPAGQVPVLVDGGRTLTESNAIMQYLADAAGDETLWPTAAWERAEVSRWLHWSATQLGPAVRPFQWERLFKPMMGMGSPDEAVLAAARDPLSKALDVLDGALTRSGEHLGGATPHLGDFAVAAAMFYAEPAGLPLDGRDRIAALRSAMAPRLALDPPAA